MGHEQTTSKHPTHTHEQATTILHPAMLRVATISLSLSTTLLVNAAPLTTTTTSAHPAPSTYQLEPTDNDDISRDLSNTLSKPHHSTNAWA